MSELPDDAQGPMAGIRVVDLTSMISGPANMAWIAGICTGFSSAFQIASQVLGAPSTYSVMIARGPPSMNSA